MPTSDSELSLDRTPLVVDLDGTLIRSDLLIESFLGLVGHNPFAAIRSLGALADGKAAFKARLADTVIIDAATLPFDEDVLRLIREAREAGRPVHLASASDERYVAAVAEHLGLFDSAIGSRADHNLSAGEKARRLVERFGAGRFDYVGDSAADVPVWREARNAYAAPGAGRRRAAAHGIALTPVGEARNRWRPYLKALRVHQWLKNVLIFAPAVAGHQFGWSLAASLIAFLSFSLCASSVYVLNDLLDIRNDRDHPRKRLRPFASGHASLVHDAALIPILLIASIALGLFLPPKFLLVLAGYYVLTLAYSLYLKRQVMLDVVALACLYGARLVAGAAATSIALSHWLEALAIFLFLSLALVKRSAELTDRVQSKAGAPSGRGYRLEDLPLVEAMAAASGYTAVLVMALYLNSPDVGSLYSSPHRLWAICVVMLYWVGRMLMKAHRGEMHDDPVVFAVRDRASQVCGLICGAAVLLAL